MECKLLTLESPELAKVEEIYNEAFPPAERTMQITNMVAYSQKVDYFNLYVALDGETVVGFFCSAEYDACAFLLFMAVDCNLRGGGYGTKLFNTIIDYYKGKPVVGTIETPVETADNYEQRVARKRFYVRNGMTITDYQVDENGVPMTVITSDPNFDVEALQSIVARDLSSIEENIKAMAE